MKTTKQIAAEVGKSTQTILNIAAELGIEKRKIGKSFAFLEDEASQIIAKFLSQDLQNLPQSFGAAFAKEEVEALKDTVKWLQNQCDKKDKQLEEKATQITSLTAALENTTASLNASQALHAGTTQKLLMDGKPGLFARLFGGKKKVEVEQ